MRDVIIIKIEKQNRYISKHGMLLKRNSKDKIKLKIILHLIN